VANPTANLTIHERGARATIRHRIERLGPYQSLLLLAVPTSIVEPLKLVAVAIAGEGHWVRGTVVIVAAYTTSLLLLERLFSIVKPKLMTLNWFARALDVVDHLARRKMAKSREVSAGHEQNRAGLRLTTVKDYAAAKRLSKSANTKILPFASIILTCHPSLAHTLALATTTSALTRSIRTVSLSRSATILYDNTFSFDLL
jgi:hypothetical protein